MYSYDRRTAAKGLVQAIWLDDKDDRPSDGIIIPAIHLNGTGKATLLKEYKEAGMAVIRALKAVQSMTVHQRDYYPKGDEAWRVARATWERQLSDLDRIRKELTAIYTGIDVAGR
jgi:predicted DNA binding protein